MEFFGNSFSRLKGKHALSLSRGCALAIVCIGAAGDLSAQMPAVRDSAGVRIVENGLPAPAPFVVARRPVIEIGANAVRPEEQFSAVRGLALLRSGAVAVADEPVRGGAAVIGALRVFDIQRKLIHSAGRTGQGPGELSSVFGIFALAGDTVAVHDGLRKSVTYFDPQGRFARVHPAPERPCGWFADGSYAAFAILRRTSADGRTVGTDSSVLVRVRGEDRDSLGLFPSGKTVVSARVSGGAPVSGTRGGRVAAAVLIAAPFGRRLSAVVHRDRVYVGDATGYEIRVLANDGRLVQVIRRGTGDRRVTRQMIDAYTDMEVAKRQGSVRVAVQRAIREMELPTEVPAFDRMILDAESGHLWIEEYPLPGARSTASRWTVFDCESGTMLGSVDMPAGFRLEAVSGRRLLGTGRDQYQASVVRLYDLVSR